MKLSPFVAFLALSSVACTAASTSPSTGSAASATTDSEIVGGTVAPPGSWPGAVAVYIGGQQSCGGTLVAPQWVVTAGHCVESPSSTTGGFDKIVAKKHKLSSSGGESIAVKQAWRHPGYNGNTMDNDIALLQLASPSTDTPVKFLPASLVATSLVTDATLTVVGWGSISEHAWSTSDDLRQVDVPYITNDKCKTFSSYENVVDSQFCAGYTTAGKDSCQGDSGGPIFMNVGGTTYQAGLVSWGIGCARANQPGVYTRVTSFIDWIKTTSGGAVDLAPATSTANAGTSTGDETPAN